MSEKVNQATVAACLGSESGMISASLIAERTGLSGIAVMNTLDKLESIGAVVSQISETTGRPVYCLKRHELLAEQEPAVHETVQPETDSLPEVVLKQNRSGFAIIEQAEEKAALVKKIEDFVMLQYVFFSGDVVRHVGREHEGTVQTVLMRLKRRGVIGYVGSKRLGLLRVLSKPLSELCYQILSPIPPLGEYTAERLREWVRQQSRLFCAADLRAAFDGLSTSALYSVLARMEADGELRRVREGWPLFQTITPETNTETTPAETAAQPEAVSADVSPEKNGCWLFWQTHTDLFCGHIVHASGESESFTLSRADAQEMVDFFAPKLGWVKQENHA